MSAKAGKNLPKEEVGGYKAVTGTGVPAFCVSNFSEIKDKIYQITALLNEPMIDADLNGALPILNENTCAENMLSVFENPVEIWSAYESEVKTVLGRIGGIAVAAVVFAGGEEGVELNAAKVAKIRTLAELAACYGLPFITFDNVKGIVPCTCTNSGRVMKEVAEYLNVLDTIDTAKIAVVYKKAIGLGYSLFASKSVGFDYTCAFANANVSLFDNAQGAAIELASETADKDKLEERYANENADPIRAAKDGYIDAIIEPQFVKQYLIASLQMFVR
jgi:acetyl-CoA carboxylase carboxyltransferase component